VSSPTDRPAFSHGGLLALAIGQGVASFAFYGATPAFGALARDWTGTLLAAGAVFACGVLPAVALGPFMSSILDRTSHRWALVLANAVCAVACAALLLFLGRVTALYWATLALAVCNLMSMICRNAAIPGLVSPARLITANAALNAAIMLGRLAGPAVMGRFTDTLGAAPTYVALCVLFALASLCSLYLPAAEATPRGLDMMRDTWAGLRYALTTPLLRALITSWAIYFFAGGAINIAEFALSVSVFGTGAATGYGFFMSVAGGGSVIGSALAARFMRHDAFAPFVAGGVLAGLITMALAVAPTLVSALAVVFCAGVCEAFRVVASNALIQRSSREDMLSRVFGAQMALAALGMGTAYLVAGAMLDILGLRFLIIIASGLMAASGPIALWMLRRAGVKADTV